MAEPTIRIPKLRGMANYARWRIDARALFIREDSWRVVCGKQLEPQASSDKSTIEHQTELEKWWRRNDTGWSTMMLILEDGPRAKVGTSEMVADIWKKLEELYSDDDLAARQNAYYQINHLDATNCKDLHEYTSELRKYSTKLDSMGYPMLPWQIVTCYLLGLPPDLEPYIFHLTQAAKSQKRELDIDEITSALVEHERGMNRDQRALATQVGNFGKQEKPEKSEKPKKEDNQNKRNDSRTRLICNHCQNIGHKKNRCFFLHLELRPKEWQARHPFLMIENIENKGAKKASAEEEDSVQTKAFSSKQLVATVPLQKKEQIFYMDTASDVHAAWDRAKFDTYAPADNLTLAGINNQKLRVHGIGSIVLPTIVDGRLRDIKITNVFHVPNIYYNMLSFSQLEDSGCELHIQNGQFNILDETQEVVFQGERIGDGYVLQLNYKEPPKALRLSTRPQINNASWDQWHKRFGHAGMSVVKEAADKTIGLNPAAADRLQQKEPPKQLCKACSLAQKALSASSSSWTTNQLLS